MKSWLQLFRAPNLFTVPGDPLAGFLLASAGAKSLRPEVLLTIVASLLLYSFGLVLNDLMDLREDRAERPARPLPSGAIKVPVAWGIAALLVFAGLALCRLAGETAFYIGAAITGVVIAYNCGLKKIPVAGAVIMGTCRGLNLLLGAALVPSFPVAVIAAASFSTIYITGVTALARTETSNPAIPPLIGRLIRALILIQAAFCSISGGLLPAAVLALVLWPLSGIVGKRFYSS